MKHKNSHLLVGYWSRLRQGRLVPAQIDVDPRAIKRMLPFVFILDAADAEAPFFRLAGTGMCERFGREMKGENFLAGWDAESARAVTVALRQALAGGQPLCLSSIGTTADCGMVELETVLTPVTFGPSGRPNRFIGLTLVLSDAASLAGQAIACQRLIATQMVSEDEPAAPLTPPPPAHPRAPHLRLVVSRDLPASPSIMTEGFRRMMENLGLRLVTTTG